jgi:hypothetical protein
MCSACLTALRANLHPVRQMCNKAYVIETQEEKQLPINVQEVMMMSFICSFRNKNEAVFRARLAASLCTEGCRVLETDLRGQTCEYWGECRLCKLVKHRQRDLISATGAFYSEHREEVDESHRLAHAKWMEWLNSWSNNFGVGPDARAAHRAAIMQELASLITALS